MRPDGTTSFSMIQAASNSGNAAALVFFLFDILHRDGEDLAPLPLMERKARLAALLAEIGAPLQYSDHHSGRGAEFHAHACKLRLEGIVSKRADAAYAPGNRRLWVKTKCLNRDEFVIVGWTDPEGWPRPHLGALLLAYYTPEGEARLCGPRRDRHDHGRTGARSQEAEPLAATRMPLDVPPPRTSRFGSPLVLSRVHWLRPELVAEVTFLTWTDDGLLRQVVFRGCARISRRAR